MMGCKEVSELLDAYALGAAEADEANAVEKHVGECLRCWSYLSETQRAAAAIALATVLQQAPDMKLERM